ncbi:Domain of unknown function DUF4203 [Lasallia pustulata]|uniref:TM7S3/TM198-like domain-containing protein n=1 Tax=Lasallia pustulata TaxID=136370 RepID=A0A1W5DE09_9LECA|nr:Domain of unknown function DUF4203 [Lasallia pustulata]
MTIMRLPWLTACLVCTISIFNGGPVVASRYAILRRQDGEPTPSLTAISSSAVRTTSVDLAAPSSTDRASPNVTSAESVVSLSQSGVSSSILQASGSTESALDAASKTTATFVPSTSTTSDSMATAANGQSGQTATASDPVRLPLHPTITPGLAVAGAILIISGTVYNLIGIKNRHLQVSLSAAFLASLSVTVLIVYVSNPPVSNAVQGAYFVAAFITGVVLGAASLVFIDVTEGLGCLLGGFAVSMWFLDLKAGGLITSTSGKAVFITALCLVAYALSFTSYTRPYGLIGGTSFAGATAVVIGIDCYSRAGLKEFWLYLWALNGNIFPLDTNTYPITRGIRVEIACIIFFSLIGIMSQLKIWKVVKERREQKAAKLQDEEHRRERSEEELGRQLEDANSRERARWEAVYGDKEQPIVQHVDSGLGSGECGSVRNGSTSITETRRVEAPSHETMDLISLEVGTRPNEGSSIMKIGDAIQEVGRQTIRLSQEEDTAFGGTYAGSLGATAAKSNSFSEPTGVSAVDDLPETTEGPASAPGEVSVPPQVMPLPFTIPSSDIDDASSMVVSAASDYLPSCKKNRLSDASLFRTLSKESRLSRRVSSSEEELAIPQVSNYQRSTQSKTASIEWLHGEHKEKEQTTAEECENARASMKRKPVPSAASPTSDYSLGAANVVDTLTQLHSDESTHTLEFAKSVPPEPLNARLQRTSLSEHLPEGGSPLVITYRTNEWAKHLDRAENPGLDELSTSVEELRPGRGKLDEVPAPVDVEGLQQTSGVPQPARKSSQPGLSGHAQQLTMAERPLMMSKDSLANLQNLQGNTDPIVLANSQSPARRPSRICLQNPQTRNGSSHQAPMKASTQQPTILVTRGSRGASAPLNGQALVESPIEEGMETAFPPRVNSPMPRNTLMAKRDTLLRNRYSFTKVAHPSLSAADPAAESIPSDSAFVHGNIVSSRDNDDIPLSQRRSLLRQIKSQTSLLQTQASSPHGVPQPLRSSSALTDMERRGLMLASWRSSVRQELNANSVPQIESELDARRAELMNEKHQLGLNRQQRAVSASYRDSMMDQAMRSSEMLDVHREAMRKMQAAANKNV